MQYQCALVVAAVALAVVRGDDDCMPPKPGDKHAHPPDCCKLDNNILPESMKTGAQKCMEKFPRPPRPSGPPPSGPPPTPTPEMKKNHACMAECIFTEAGLLADKKLDKAAITKTFTTTDKDVASVISAAIDKCFSSYEKDVDTSIECKSGAAEFEKCVFREVFLNCPRSKWNDSSECTDLKSRVNKCPQVPVMMMHPRGDRPN